MELKEHYDKLWKESVAGFKKGQFQVDPLLDSNLDGRRGMSLVIRPPKEIYDNVSVMMEELRKIAPEQYYYPFSDMHITIMPIVSCFEGFKTENIDLDKYVERINNSITKISKITYSGLTASSACIMLCGYSENNVLNELRNRLRNDFESANLAHSMDQRYRMVTAHSTIVRFKSNFKYLDRFLSAVERYISNDFGSFEVDTFELVYNDWYQKQANRKLLHTFHLKD